MSVFDVYSFITVGIMFFFIIVIFQVYINRDRRSVVEVSNSFLSKGVYICEFLLICFVLFPIFEF
jgi:hypothetical protein